jgi:hypothetical protein
VAHKNGLREKLERQMMRFAYVRNTPSVSVATLSETDYYSAAPLEL